MATKKTSSKSKTKKKTTKPSALKVTVSSKRSKKITLQSINKWNIGLAVIFAAQAVAIIVLSQSVSLPVVTHYLGLDTLASKAAGHSVFAPTVRHLFDVRLAWLVAAFLLVAAITHLLIATYFRKHYETDLSKKTSCFRWGEYALGGGLVLITIGFINGAYDLSVLLSLFVLVVLAALFSLLIELYKDKLAMKSWLINTFALLTGVVPWVIVGLYTKGAVFYGNGLPHYVYWATGVTFVLFVASAVNMYLQGQGKNRWADYLHAERMYMLIGLAAKSALAWLVFAGALR